MNYSIIPNKNNIEKALEFSEKYGVNFEYNEFTAPETYDNPDEVQKIIEFYKNINRDRSNDTMHGAFLGVDIAAMDPMMRVRSRKLCKQSLEIARSLGIKGVVFHTGLIGTLRVEYYVNNWLDEAVDFFTELCKEFPELFIYMENSFEQEPDVFVRLMERMKDVPNFRLCLDYGHAILTTTDVSEWVKAFAPYLSHMHLNDNDLKDDLHLAVGKGKIDFGEFKYLINENIPEYEGSVLLEMNGYDLAEESIEYLAKIDASEYSQKHNDAECSFDMCFAEHKNEHVPNHSNCDVDNKKLQKILDIGIALSVESDPNQLLSLIVDSAMDLTNCDGGSLYVLREDGLHFAVMKTRSKGVDKVFAEHFFGGHDDNDDCKEDLLPPIPLIESNVCAFAAIHKKSLNIPDVYASDLFDFSGPKKYDAQNGYKTTSMVTIPMIDQGDEVIGVMQLLNSMDEDGAVVEFSAENEHIITSLASQTAICLSNMIFVKEMDRQIWSFTEAMTEVIDMRTPYNGNHTKHVAKYVEMVANHVNELHEKGEEELFFTKEHIAQLVMAAYLHDIGKIITPKKVMNKQTRLEHHIESIRLRLLYQKSLYELQMLMGTVSKEDYNTFIENVDRALELADEMNTDRPLTEEQEKKINEVEQLKYYDLAQFATIPFFTQEEINCMKIRRGTLTDAERQIMQDHVSDTRKILNKVYFNREFKQAPIWAAQHHECLNGTGYPDKLTADEIGVEARILAVADICDALLATDRPYKKPMPKEVAFRIMKEMADEGKLDMKFVEYLCICVENENR